MMSWSRQRLETEWIGAPINVLGDRATAALTAFECVERHLGAEWLVARHLRGPTGPAPTLGLVLLGECLAGIENLQGFDLLIEKIRAGDISAQSEIEAVYLFRLIDDVEIELAPDLLVGTAMKKPDFRVRRGREPWTYVEVTRPDISEEAVAAQNLLQRLLDVVRVRREFSLEIFLRREPTAIEEQDLLLAARSLADSDTFEILDLPHLAIVTKQPFAGPFVTPLNHTGEDNTCPRFGGVTMLIGGDGSEPQRIVSARIPFSDDRADSFLKREAKQLSKGERGLIVMDMTSSQNGMSGWDVLLRRRLQPSIHTRVGGICLFTTGLESGTTASLELLFDLIAIENLNAAQPLPGWILDGFRKLALAEDLKRTVPRQRSSI
jgi:hypothetical protein